MRLRYFSHNEADPSIDRAKRIYGYLSKMKYVMIHAATDEPDMSNIFVTDYDFTYFVFILSFYGYGADRL